MPSDTVVHFPQTSPTDPLPVLSGINDQLAAAAGLLAAELSGTDFATSPTTYQTLRWLGGAVTSCQAKLAALAKAKGIALWPVAETGLLLIQLQLVAADFENRVIGCLNPKGELDQLPAGNPGEPQFEKELTALIAVNKAYSECLNELGLLSNALGSDTYKIGIGEEERVKAWRAARKAELAKALSESNKALMEAEEYTDKVRKARDSIVAELETNDQMLFTEIDKNAAPVLES